VITETKGEVQYQGKNVLLKNEWNWKTLL